MCGIFGVVGLRSDLQRRAVLFRALAVLNESRGEHSHGVAAIDVETKAYKLVKRAGKASKVADFRAWRNAVMSSADVLIGHNRFATHGEINDANAHPFRIGSVIGSHNGVCHNTDQLAPLCGGVKYAVDSQYLIHMLNLQGNIGPARGSLNLAWWSSRWSDGEALRLQKAGNPLHFWESKTGDGLIYSSEDAHLRKAMAIAGNFGKGEVYFMSDYSELSVRLRAGRCSTIYTAHRPTDAPYTVTSYAGGAASYRSNYAYDDTGYEIGFVNKRAQDTCKASGAVSGKLTYDKGAASVWRRCDWCEELLKEEKFATPNSRVCLECRRASDNVARSNGAAIGGKPEARPEVSGDVIDGGPGKSKAIYEASAHAFAPGSKIVCKYSVGSQALAENAVYTVESSTFHPKSKAYSVRLYAVQGAFLTYRFQALEDYTADHTKQLRERLKREAATDKQTHGRLVSELEKCERTVIVLMDSLERCAEGPEREACAKALKQAEAACVAAENTLCAWEENETGGELAGGAADMQAEADRTAAAESRQGAGPGGSDLPAGDSFNVAADGSREAWATDGGPGA